MIPVPESSVQLLNIFEQEEKYRVLLNEQMIFIKEHEQEIYKKATITYKGVVNRTNKFLINISCDFKILEKYYKDFKK